MAEILSQSEIDALINVDQMPYSEFISSIPNPSISKEGITVTMCVGKKVL